MVDPLASPGQGGMSLHQGDLDGEKGIHLTNVVDEVTRYEFVGVVEAISEAFLLPVFEALIDAFPSGSSASTRTTARSTSTTTSPGCSTSSMSRSSPSRAAALQRQPRRRHRGKRRPGRTAPHHRAGPGGGRVTRPSWPPRAWRGWAPVLSGARVSTSCPPPLYCLRGPRPWTARGERSPAHRTPCQPRPEPHDDPDSKPGGPFCDGWRALSTPVQTAVKREDEQEFARLNAANLMFCEDAGRRLKSVLDVNPEVLDFHVRVEHHESLHAHDAISVFAKGVPGGYTAVP